MMKKTLHFMLLALALYMLILPASKGTFLTTVHAEPENSQLPTISVDKKDGTITFGTNEATNIGTSTDRFAFWGDILEKGRIFVVGISGIGALVAIGVFIMSFIKLGLSAGNPQTRTQALTGILWSGIAVAGLGSVTLIAGLFYGALHE